VTSIESLAQRIESLGSPAARKDVSSAMGAESAKSYRQGFDKKVDPYGTLWAPRKDQVKKRNWKSTSQSLMVRSGDLRDDLRLQADENGFRLTSAMSYGVFHQFGTVNMVARKIMPDAAQGLGAWDRPLVLAALKVIRGLLK
jgi:phage gpG-like protein